MRSLYTSRKELCRRVSVPTVSLALIFSAVLSISTSQASGDPEEPAIQPSAYVKKIAPGSAAHFRVTISRAETRSAQLGKRQQPLDATSYGEFDLIVRTRRGTPPGKRSLTVDCPAAGDQIAYAVVVQRRKGPAARHRKIQLLARPIGPPLPGPNEAAQEALQRWARDGAAILEGFRSGQCTDWAAQKRPDVIERVMEAEWAAESRHLEPPPPLAGAQEWPISAAAVGFSISDYPRPGALVVWREGVEGAISGSGHVGYVESVSPAGLTFSTSEMNFGEPYAMGYRTLSTSPVDGRTFILP